MATGGTYTLTWSDTGDVAGVTYDVIWKGSLLNGTVDEGSATGVTSPYTISNLQGVRYTIAVVKHYPDGSACRSDGTEVIFEDVVSPMDCTGASMIVTFSDFEGKEAIRYDYTLPVGDDPDDRYMAVYIAFEGKKPDGSYVELFTNMQNPKHYPVWPGRHSYGSANSTVDYERYCEIDYPHYHGASTTLIEREDYIAGRITRKQIQTDADGVVIATCTSVREVEWMPSCFPIPDPVSGTWTDCNAVFTVGGAAAPSGYKYKCDIRLVSTGGYPQTVTRTVTAQSLPTVTFETADLPPRALGQPYGLQFYVDVFLVSDTTGASRWCFSHMEPLGAPPSTCNIPTIDCAPNTPSPAYVNGNIEWAPVTDVAGQPVTGYKVYWKDPKAMEGAEWKVIGSSSPYTIVESAYTPGFHTFAVSAYKDNCPEQGKTMESSKATLNISLPSGTGDPPTNPQVDTTSCPSMVISWTPVTSSALITAGYSVSYEVQSCRACCDSAPGSTGLLPQNCGVPYSSIGTTSSSSITHTLTSANTGVCGTSGGCSPNHGYSYSVRAIYTKGIDTKYSNYVQASGVYTYDGEECGTCGDPPTKDCGDAYSAPSPTISGNVISWAAVTGVTGYNIYSFSSALGTDQYVQTKVGSTTSTSYTISGTAAMWGVSAYKNGYPDSLSTCETSIATATPPDDPGTSPPTDPTITDAGCGKIELSWSAPTDADALDDGYTLSYEISGNCQPITEGGYGSDMIFKYPGSTGTVAVSGTSYTMTLDWGARSNASCANFRFGVIAVFTKGASVLRSSGASFGSWNECTPCPDTEFENDCPPISVSKQMDGYVMQAKIVIGALSGAVTYNVYYLSGTRRALVGSGSSPQTLTLSTAGLGSLPLSDYADPITAAAGYYTFGVQAVNSEGTLSRLCSSSITTTVPPVTPECDDFDSVGLSAAWNAACNVVLTWAAPETVPGYTTTYTIRANNVASGANANSKSYEASSTSLTILTANLPAKTPKLGYKLKFDIVVNFIPTDTSQDALSCKGLGTTYLEEGDCTPPVDDCGPTVPSPAFKDGKIEWKPVKDVNGNAVDGYKVYYLNLQGNWEQVGSSSPFTIVETNYPPGLRVFGVSAYKNNCPETGQVKESDKGTVTVQFPFPHPSGPKDVNYNVTGCPSSPQLVTTWSAATSGLLDLGYSVSYEISAIHCVFIQGGTGGCSKSPVTDDENNVTDEFVYATYSNISSPFTLDLPTAGRCIMYGLRAIFTNGTDTKYSFYTTTSCFIPCTNPPSPPKEPCETAYSAPSPTISGSVISWAAVPGVDGYNIYSFTKKVGSAEYASTKVGSTSSTSYTISGTAAMWGVSAYKNGYPDSLSTCETSIVKVNPPGEPGAEPPTDVTATDVGCGKFELSWSAPAAAAALEDNYVLSYRISGISYPETHGGATPAAMPVQMDSPGTEYMLTIPATNSEACVIYGLSVEAIYTKGSSVLKSSPVAFPQIRECFPCEGNDFADNCPDISVTKGTDTTNPKVTITVSAYSGSASYSLYYLVGNKRGLVATGATPQAITLFTAQLGAYAQQDYENPVAAEAGYYTFGIQATNNLGVLSRFCTARVSTTVTPPPPDDDCVPGAPDYPDCLCPDGECPPPPPPPANCDFDLTITNLGNGTVQLSWTSKEGATLYSISGTGGQNYTTVSTAAVIPNLSNGTHTFVVSTTTPDCGQISATGTVSITDGRALCPFTTSTTQALGIVTLQIQPPQQTSNCILPTLYKIYVDTAFYTNTVALTAVLPCLPNGNHVIGVIGTAGDLNSQIVNSSINITDSTCTPPPPGVIRANYIEDCMVQLEWDVIPQARGYVIYRKTGFSWALVGKTTKLNFSAYGLSNGTYIFGVSSLVGFGESEIVSISVNIVCPPKFSLIEGEVPYVVTHDHKVGITESIIEQRKSQDFATTEAAVVNYVEAATATKTWVMNYVSSVNTTGVTQQWVIQYVASQITDSETALIQFIRNAIDMSETDMHEYIRNAINAIPPVVFPWQVVDNIDTAKALSLQHADKMYVYPEDED
jgi:hypothetical protein